MHFFFFFLRFITVIVLLNKIFSSELCFLILISVGPSDFPQDFSRGLIIIRVGNQCGRVSVLVHCARIVDGLRSKKKERFKGDKLDGEFVMRDYCASVQNFVFLWTTSLRYKMGFFFY